jgi:MoxR-like ATPase
MPESKVDDTTLKDVRDTLIRDNPGKPVRAWQIRDALKAIDPSYLLDESTIRGRFCAMGEPLRGGSQAQASTGQGEGTMRTKAAPKPTQFIQIQEREYQVDEDMKKYIPPDSEFTNYVERPVDRRLMIHMDAGKHPIAQGKQGTGKTFGFMYYAWKKKLPFFLFSCYEDMRLQKLFGDKTIQNGDVKFVEGLFTRAIQCPSVVLFDEVNAISNSNTFDFHALLQNHELFVKDADDGNGKLYRLHPDCRIGFAQNPKSSKYIGGNIKPSNFLGRCTYITYPEFSKKEIREAVSRKFPELGQVDLKNFVDYYYACTETIDKAGIPVDISIRQLLNMIDLYMHGLPLHVAIEDGLTSITEAISQPKLKESFYRLSQAVWKELMDKSEKENVGKF